MWFLPTPGSSTVKGQKVHGTHCGSLVSAKEAETHDFAFIHKCIKINKKAMTSHKSIILQYFSLSQRHTAIGGWIGSFSWLEPAHEPVGDPRLINTIFQTNDDKQQKLQLVSLELSNNASNNVCTLVIEHSLNRTFIWPQAFKCC